MMQIRWNDNVTMMILGMSILQIYDEKFFKINKIQGTF